MGIKKLFLVVQGDHLKEGVGFFFVYPKFSPAIWKPSMASGSSRFTGGNLSRPFAQVIPIAFCILATVAAQDAGFHDSWDVFFLSKNRSRLE